MCRRSSLILRRCKARLQTLQSTLLLIFNLIALLATLVYIWVIYSQMVVIRHHWSRPASLAINPTTPDQSAPAVTAEIDAQPSIAIEAGDVVTAPVETPPAAVAPAEAPATEAPTADQPEKSSKGSLKNSLPKCPFRAQRGIASAGPRPLTRLARRIAAEARWAAFGVTREVIFLRALREISASTASSVGTTQSQTCTGGMIYGTPMKG